jgi:integrase
VDLAKGFYADGLPFTRGTVVRRAAFGTVGGNAVPATLRSAVDAYKKDKEARWEAKTALMQAAALDLFARLIGDKPLNSVKRQDCKRARDVLARLPPNMAKRFSKLSIEEVLALRMPAMSPKTANWQISSITGFFKWCVAEGLIDESPARGLLLPIQKRADQDRDAYQLDHLKLIFGALKPSMGARYWLPLVALYSGMRLEEIAQLRTADLRQVGDTWAFDVNGAEGKKLKTASAARLIPVHPRLLELGLIEYRAMQVQGGKKALWPDLKKGADGFHSSPFSKWFGRFKLAVGVHSRKLTFHSFRHTFINELKQAGVDELLIRELVGHANPSITTGRYGKRYDLPKLLAAIENMPRLL